MAPRRRSAAVKQEQSRGLKTAATSNSSATNASSARPNRSSRRSASSQGSQANNNDHVSNADSKSKDASVNGESNGNASGGSAAAGAARNSRSISSRSRSTKHQDSKKKENTPEMKAEEAHQQEQNQQGEEVQKVVKRPFKVADNVPVSTSRPIYSKIKNPLSIKDTAVLYTTLKISRQYWLTNMFDLYWSKHTDRLKNVADDGDNNKKLNIRDRMNKLCDCILIGGPHSFEVRLFILKNDDVEKEHELSVQKKKEMKKQRRIAREEEMKKKQELKKLKEEKKETLTVKKEASVNSENKNDSNNENNSSGATLNSNKDNATTNPSNSQKSVTDPNSKVSEPSTMNKDSTSNKNMHATTPRQGELSQPIVANKPPVSAPQVGAAIESTSQKSADAIQNKTIPTQSISANQQTASKSQVSPLAASVPSNVNISTKVPSVGASNVPNSTDGSIRSSPATQQQTAPIGSNITFSSTNPQASQKTNASQIGKKLESTNESDVNDDATRRSSGVHPSVPRDSVLHDLNKKKIPDVSKIKLIPTSTIGTTLPSTVSSPTSSDAVSKGTTPVLDSSPQVSLTNQFASKSASPANKSVASVPVAPPRPDSQPQPSVSNISPAPSVPVANNNTHTRNAKNTISPVVASPAPIAANPVAPASTPTLTSAPATAPITADAPTAVPTLSHASNTSQKPQVPTSAPAPSASTSVASPVNSTAPPPAPPKPKTNDIMQSPENTIMIRNLNSIARIDPHLDTLMKIVASGRSSPSQIHEFQGYIKKAREMGRRGIDDPKIFFKQLEQEELQRKKNFAPWVTPGAGILGSNGPGSMYHYNASAPYKAPPKPGFSMAPNNLQPNGTSNSLNNNINNNNNNNINNNNNNNKQPASAKPPRVKKTKEPKPKKEKKEDSAKAVKKESKPKVLKEVKVKAEKIKEQKLTAFQERYLKDADLVFEFSETPTERYRLPKDSIVEALDDNKLLISYIMLNNQKSHDLFGELWKVEEEKFKKAKKEKEEKEQNEKEEKEQNEKNEKEQNEKNEKEKEKEVKQSEQKVEADEEEQKEESKKEDGENGKVESNLDAEAKSTNEANGSHAEQGTEKTQSKTEERDLSLANSQNSDAQKATDDKDVQNKDSQVDEDTEMKEFQESPVETGKVENSEQTNEKDNTNANAKVKSGDHKPKKGSKRKSKRKFVPRKSRRLASLEENQVKQESEDSESDLSEEENEEETMPEAEKEGKKDKIEYMATTLMLNDVPKRFIPLIANSFANQETVYRKMELIIKHGIKHPSYYLWYSVDGIHDEKMAENLRYQLSEVENAREKKKYNKARPSTSNAASSTSVKAESPIPSGAGNSSRNSNPATPQKDTEKKDTEKKDTEQKEQKANGNDGEKSTVDVKMEDQN